MKTVQQLIREFTKRGGAGIREARREYAELRKTAVKRIERARAHGELLDEPFPIQTKDIPKNDPAALAKATRNVQKFLESKRSTAAGRKETRAQTVQTLQDMGYKNVTVDNAKLFADYMEMWRRKYETMTPDGRRMLFDSDFAVEIFDNISEKFTERTNTQSMSRMFNDYLRAEGMESWIVYL